MQSYELFLFEQLIKKDNSIRPLLLPYFTDQLGSFL